MFSQELMDIFRIDNSVADLDEQVDKRSVFALYKASICTRTKRTAQRRHVADDDSLHFDREL
jgi:hypothetical protein